MLNLHVIEYSWPDYAVQAGDIKALCKTLKLWLDLVQKSPLSLS